jgi:glycosidase
VFYEVFVRSFQDSDGDGIGDLRGLTSRLDQLNDGDPATTDDLGVTGLWLMPVAESPSYHGYDVTDYRTVERDYGTADDFRALIAAAHERGIAVIVDLVINHTSCLSSGHR